jgi:hypothetical protein
MPAWLLPAIAGGASLVSGLFGNKAKNDQAKADAKLYNDWLRNYQATGQGLYGQAQAAGWNPFGPQVSTTTGSQTGTSSMQGGSRSNYSNRPVITEEYAPIDQLMRGLMTGRLSGGSSLPAGYASNAARGINESYEGADAAARNMAARRGLSGEQSYAVASPVARARAGALADMRGNLPLLERQMQNEDIAIAQGLQSAFGRGEAGQQESRNWQSGQTSSQSSGQSSNPFGASDLAALMGVLAPPSPYQSGKTGTSGLATGMDNIAGLLGFLASQQNNPTGFSQNPMEWMKVGNQAARYGGLGALQYNPIAGNPF